ncbi:MAG: TetR/AcrR family transcriptional regulator [Clostridia bacterium]|nr:TetR/AcrR family transcriptional regulator [Clostridia bacterium]
MPSQTFFNLSEEKRERIIEAAIDEFANNSIKNASIARIISEAGIPRGSFYQYFIDIKDLYKYIFTLTGEKKIQYLSHCFGNFNEMKVFQLIRELYVAGLRFAGEHPKMARIGNNLLREEDVLKEKIMGELEERSQQFFEDLLRKGQEQGEIDPGMDLKIGAFMFFALNIAITNYFLAGSAKMEHVLENRQEYLNLVDKMLYILENGMKGGR